MQILDYNGQDATVLYVLLLYSGKYDFLPDLYDVAGHELTVKLLDVFAGATVKFPSVGELTKLATEVQIYTRISIVPKTQRASVIKELADDYNTQEVNIRNIYARVSNTIETDLGMEVFRGKRRFRRHLNSSFGRSNRRREKSSTDNR